MAAAGLQSHIWNNNLKSVVLLALYPFIMLVLVWGCAYVIGVSQYGTGQADLYQLTITGEGRTIDRTLDHTGTASAANFAFNIVYEFWPAILTVVAIWFMIAYFFHTNMIRKLSHAHSVSREDEPELYNLLENLCIAQGMPIPKLNIIETHARNAFASGIDRRSYTVTVTRGLMNSLTKDELEAVLAHELTHILNRDVRLLMVTVIFTGMIGFAAQLVWSSVRYNLIFGRRQREGGGGIIILLAIAAVLWVGYMATLFMRFALSRRREYMADAGAVEMTKNPEAMMAALMRIADRAQIPETTDDIMMMCVENKSRFMGLFATHPPIDKRIRAISKVTNTPVPELEHTGPVQKNQRFVPERKGKNPWLISNRGQRRGS